MDENRPATQCIHCGRTQRHDPAEHRGWVPARIAQVPDDASVGLCPSGVAKHDPQLLTTLA